MHFGYTIVYVPDVKAAVEFYRDAFGVQPKAGGDFGDYAECDTGDTTLSFSAERMADELGVAITPNRLNSTSAGIELAFVTEDVPASYTRAIEAGATAVTEPKQMPWGQTVSYVRDLNGVLVEICSPVSG
jgi:uncharacterized glyoxalase superfamily protein PhnB